MLAEIEQTDSIPSGKIFKELGFIKQGQSWQIQNGKVLIQGQNNIQVVEIEPKPLKKDRQDQKNDQGKGQLDFDKENFKPSDIQQFEQILQGESVVATSNSSRNVSGSSSVENSRNNGKHSNDTHEWVFEGDFKQ